MPDSPEILSAREASSASPVVAELVVAQMEAEAKERAEQIKLLLSLTQTASSAAQASQSAVEGIRSEMEARAAELSAIASQAVASKSQIADYQAVIATKSEHIQAAQEHADKVRGELDRTLTTATRQATEAEGLKDRAQSATDTANELLAEIRASKGAVDGDAEAITEVRLEGKASAEALKVLADKAETVQGQIAAYELRLKQLEDQSKQQLETIVGLLPGATSAGLAHAFDARRQTFLQPQQRWQWLFITSVVMLAILAITGLWHVLQATGEQSYDQLLRLWLARLPVAGALVWLALHASRESALAKRLEEDYGYKATIAASFLGFNKQMSEIGKTAEAGSPLAKLCADTLTTIASPPGRIYDKHQLTVSPVDELKDLAKTVQETLPIQGQPKKAY
ncbi:MAG: hypothetical protein JWN23_963 [Rhodocyclales bacterium]|nr:hypothetical protein [Rhodocyclales bacterium]